MDCDSCYVSFLGHVFCNHVYKPLSWRLSLRGIEWLTPYMTDVGCVVA